MWYCVYQQKYWTKTKLNIDHYNYSMCVAFHWCILKTYLNCCFYILTCKIWLLVLSKDFVTTHFLVQVWDSTCTQVWILFIWLSYINCCVTTSCILYMYLYIFRPLSNFDVIIMYCICYLFYSWIKRVAFTDLTTNISAIIMFSPSWRFTLKTVKITQIFIVSLSNLSIQN